MMHLCGVEASETFANRKPAGASYEILIGFKHNEDATEWTGESPRG